MAGPRVPAQQDLVRVAKDLPREPPRRRRKEERRTWPELSSLLRFFPPPPCPWRVCWNQVRDVKYK